MFPLFFFFNILPLATLGLTSQSFLEQKENSKGVHRALSLWRMVAMQVEAHVAEGLPPVSA